MQTFLFASEETTAKALSFKTLHICIAAVPTPLAPA
jgi:hypothetical protein